MNGLPSINISFISAAERAVVRSQKGVVAIILRDAQAPGLHTLTAAAQIPTDLGAGNADYVARAFLGYVNRPRAVILCVIDAEAPIADALASLATVPFDYLAAMPEVTAAECSEIVAWVTARREEEHAIYKAVLPHTAADSEAVINFTTDGIVVGEDTYTAAAYCSRIAGLIAGTPMNISCTFAPLPEVALVAPLTRAAQNLAIDAGEFILFHDGEKVKVGRGVNSLQTLTGKSAQYKKIKLVETMDMISHDLRVTAAGTYIGKYANTYDNKVILITAIKDYFSALERAELLIRGTSTVEIDLGAQMEYLVSKGVDVSAMSEQAIKEAPTDEKVFLTASVRMVDAIEDIDVQIAI